MPNALGSYLACSTIANSALATAAHKTRRQAPAAQTRKLGLAEGAGTERRDQDSLLVGVAIAAEGAGEQIRRFHVPDPSGLDNRVHQGHSRERDSRRGARFVRQGRCVDGGIDDRGRSAQWGGRRLLGLPEHAVNLQNGTGRVHQHPDTGRVAVTIDFESDDATTEWEDALILDDEDQWLVAGRVEP